MSHAHDSHDHHHKSSPDHVPHVTPLSIYLRTFATLVVLTAITVGVSYVDLGTAVNLTIALTIATIKASIVAAFFMHLAVDSKFNTIVFASGAIFLLIFVVFTSFDTNSRGRFDPMRGRRPPSMSDPFASPSASASAAPAAAAPKH
ncbi:MAG: cytochrome C oxidase subunit IV family protein [Polyangiaceae bacterium]